MSRMIEGPSLEELRRVSDLLAEAPSWTLFTHQKADGDALGSLTALFGAGRLQGKHVRWMGLDKAVTPAYRFLDHTEHYALCPVPFSFSDPKELYVFLDCANVERSVKDFTAPAPGVRVLNIDHHEDNTLFGTTNCVDPGSSSTSELVFRILRMGGWPLSRGIAQSLYVGIWTDSGGFTFSNTSPETHRLVAELIELGVEPDVVDDEINQTRTPAGVALWGRAFSHVRVFGPGNVFALGWLGPEDFKAVGAEASDTEGLPGSLMKIHGVRLAVFLTELSPAKIKASFRSRGGIFPAAEVARSFGGGGHPRAAGATLTGDLAGYLETIPKLLEDHYAEWDSAD